jgi:hypothetical protein
MCRDLLNMEDFVEAQLQFYNIETKKPARRNCWTFRILNREQIDANLKERYNQDLEPYPSYVVQMGRHHVDAFDAETLRKSIAIKLCSCVLRKQN